MFHFKIGSYEKSSTIIACSLRYGADIRSDSRAAPNRNLDRWRSRQYIRLEGSLPERIQSAAGNRPFRRRVHGRGSTDLDNFKEVDLSVGYSVRGFSVGVTDYWWGGQRLGDGRFAPYFKYGDTHYFEGTLAYEFGEKFPLGISWSTMFAGADKKENGDRAWSSYVELAYPFSVGSVELTAAAGAAPWAAPAWLPGGYDGFQISNVSLKASRAIPVSEKYEIPLFVQLAVNPQLNYMNLVIGLSF